MAVNITATAVLRDGLFKDEAVRSQLLETLGLNKNLLADTKAALSIGIEPKLLRKAVLDDTDYLVQVTFDLDYRLVKVQAFDSTTANVGFAVFGMTKFFDCVEPSIDFNTSDCGYTHSNGEV